jgi:hypothetical protein
MVFCNLSEGVPLDAPEVASALEDQDVLVGVVGPRRFRLVIHYWIDDAGVDHAVESLGGVVEK